MDLILNSPSYIKVGLSFLGILIAYRFGVALGYSILFFSAVLTLWTGTELQGFIYQYKALLSPENYLLLVVILMLLLFTESLDKSGRMKKTIDALKSLFKSKKLLLGGLPAMIGFLPMPGGALFSAPLVDAADHDKSVDPVLKTSINYWFRHVWEYWWPLYPGIIMSIKYSGLPAGLFYLIQMPLSIASIAGGYFFILHKVKDNTIYEKNKSFNLKEILAAFIPIFIVVFCSLTGSFVFPLIGMGKTLSNLTGMLAGLILGFILMFYNNIDAFIKSLSLFKKKNTIEMMVLVLGILFFSTALKIPLNNQGSITLVTQMRDEFLSMGIPLLLVMALIPFISGAVTGIAFGFVGASFPIVFALIGNNPQLNVVIAATTFTYVCGYVGMI
ncbi:MAG: DUF401 family protein, partial [Spirochaetes bacterium]|nr:DUF401 family protein [Spirochaetota bacterium]